MNGETRETRECKSCKGTGESVLEAFEFEGKSYPREVRPCSICRGLKAFPEIDIKAIVGFIMTTRGKKRFRTSWPKNLCQSRWGDINVARAYYVWRLARFHGGKDVTMPVMADLIVRGDPYKPELDFLADHVAKKVFGTDMAAAFRWANALGGSVPVPKGMPATAYSGGPVVEGEKPDFEIGELF